MIPLEPAGGEFFSTLSFSLILSKSEKNITYIFICYFSYNNSLVIELGWEVEPIAHFKTKQQAMTPIPLLLLHLGHNAYKVQYPCGYFYVFLLKKKKQDRRYNLPT